jgi:hypothetical protein
MRALLKREGRKAGSLDYVAAWFIKASRYAAHALEGSGTLDQVRGEEEGTRGVSPIRHPGLEPGSRFSSPPRIGLVSTNSIVQGEQVAQLWPVLFRAGAEIAFAHRTFVWPGRAAVHCVIVGLAMRGDEPTEKRLFSYADGKGEAIETRVPEITGYLFASSGAGKHLVVSEGRQPLSPTSPRMRMGSKPVDGGHLIVDASQRANLLALEPEAAPLLFPYIGAREFINGGMRWIISAQDASPSLLRSLPEVTKRLKSVRDFRAASQKDKTRELADTPASFEVDTRPQSSFLVIPEVSSERREYIPIGWLGSGVIPSNKLLTIPDATLFDLGVLTSRMHMAWMRQFGGRLKSDFQYSPGQVYNTFPWPEATPAQRAQVEALAQAVLDARSLPKNATSTLADLYDPDTMPGELRKAHRELDLAVDRLYRRQPFASDRERVEHLFTLYQRLVDPLQHEGVRQNKRVARRSRRVAPAGDGTDQLDPGSGPG